MKINMKLLIEKEEKIKKRFQNFQVIGDPNASLNVLKGSYYKGFYGTTAKSIVEKIEGKPTHNVALSSYMNAEHLYYQYKAYEQMLNIIDNAKRLCAYSSEAKDYLEIQMTEVGRKLREEFKNKRQEYKLERTTPLNDILELGANNPFPQVERNLQKYDKKSKQELLLIAKKNELLIITALKEQNINYKYKSFVENYFYGFFDNSKEESLKLLGKDKDDDIFNYYDEYFLKNFIIAQDAFYHDIVTVPGDFINASDERSKGSYISKGIKDQTIIQSFLHRSKYKTTPLATLKELCGNDDQRPDPDKSDDGYARQLSLY